MFAVSATVTVRKGKWSVTRQVPTFFLSPGVQGILGIDAAEKIAMEVVNPTGDPSVLVSLTVVKV